MRGLIAVAALALVAAADAPKHTRRVVITNDNLKTSAADKAERTKARTSVESLFNLILSGSKPLFIGASHHVLAAPNRPVIVETDDMGAEQTGDEPSMLVGGVRLMNVNPWVKVEPIPIDNPDAAHDVYYAFESGAGAAPVSQLVRYEQIYPGITMTYNPLGDGMELRFEIDGGDIDSILLAFDRQDYDLAFTECTIDKHDADASLTSAGTPGVFRIATVRRMTKEKATIALDFIGSERSMNRQQPLGLSGAGYATAVDDRGNTYFVGSASVAGAPFVPGTVRPRRGRDVALARVGPTGAIDFVSYFGGSDDEDGPFGIALDPFGDLIVSGTTRSADFPKLVKDNRLAGGTDIFLARFNRGGVLQSAMLLGGKDDDHLAAMAGGAQIHLAGWTTSDDFPVTADALQSKRGGGRDAFYLRLAYDPRFTRLYGTYLGGSSDDAAQSVAVDDRSVAILAGRMAGGAFVARFDPAQPKNVQTRMIAGSTGMAVAGEDRLGTVYLVTTAAAGMPVTDGVVQRQNAGGSDLYLAHLSEDLTQITRATYLGGAEDDVLCGASIDADGNVFVVGATTSFRFPTTTPRTAAWEDQYQHLFAAWVRPDLDTVSFSTFFAVDPTNAAAAPIGVTLDRQRNLIVAGKMNLSSLTPDAPVLERMRLTTDGVSISIPNPDSGAWPWIRSVKAAEPGWLHIEGEGFSDNPSVFLDGTAEATLRNAKPDSVDVQLPADKTTGFTIELVSKASHSDTFIYGAKPRPGTGERPEAPRPKPLALTAVALRPRQFAVAGLLLLLGLVMAGRRG